MIEVRTVIETGSTNIDLLALAADGVSEGTWLRAERQTGGRGRHGRSWISPPGNLYASTVVRLSPGDPPAATLALVSAVALHQALSTLAGGETLQIKWPNDILAGGAKLAGILLERSGHAVVIGFGANLAHHPESLDRPVTSLAAMTGAAPDPAVAVCVLADAFARWLGCWRAQGIGPVRTRWLSAAHPLGTALMTSGGDGLFDGLDDTGALRLRLADGTSRVIHAGDVFLI